MNIDPILKGRLESLLYAFLTENTKLNLSAFRTEDHCWIGNITDSLALLDLESTLPELKSATSLIDIGTGGGFPLLPLAIARPHLRCLGVDATKKKVDAVERIMSTLHLENVAMRCERLEILGHQEGVRSSATIVTARTLAPLSVLLEYAVPLLAVGGICAFWKSTKFADELAASAKAQAMLHARFLRTYEYDLPPSWGRRAILLFRKTKETPSTFPREVGMPKAKPL